jgi:hypothetical protein
MKFTQGDRVKHPNKLDWGIGQVLDGGSGDSVRVFFVGAGEKTLSLKFVDLIKVQGVESAHPVLDNLKVVRKSGGCKYRSLPLLRENFLKVFPDGFYGGAYHRHERNYKVDAHDLMAKTLGQSDFNSLLSSANYQEICKRALSVVNKTNLIFPNEKMSLKEGLASESGQKLFSETLFSLLYGEGDLENRFDAFADALERLGAAKWTVATYFPFITFPDQHIFLKPEVTQKAAEVCGFELNYRGEVNWLTYSKLLEFSRFLFTSLSELNPRDMIDVQSFIWCTARIDEGDYVVD